MKNISDKLKEKEIKQEKAIDQNELEGASGGWFWEDSDSSGTYYIDMRECINYRQKG